MKTLWQRCGRASITRITLFLLPFLFASACAAPATTTIEATPAPTSATSGNFPLTITDAIGQEFTFDAPPKIGCAWYGCHETLADLGIPPAAASMSEEEANSVFYAPAGPPVTLIEDYSNPEVWAAAEVELIVTRVPASADNDVLAEAAPIFYLHHPSYGESDQQGYQAYLENLRLLGQLSGQPEAADAAIARFENFLANLRQLATPATADLTVAVLFGGDSYSGLTRENPFCALLAEVGLGQCPGPENPEEFWPEVNAEQFLAIDPDWIVYEGFGASYTERTDPVWGQLTAVKEGRVYDAAPGGRSYCCSTRGLIHSLQDYISHILPESGIPSPGPHLEFDPLTSPLVAEPEGASADSAQSLFPVTVTDAAGQEFTFDAPSRIGCWWTGCSEILAELGVVAQAGGTWLEEGFDSQLYFPDGPPVHNIEDWSNAELWAAAEVDLLIIRVPDSPNYDALKEVAPIFFMHHASYGESSETGYQAYLENIRLGGQLTGKPQEAEAAIARFETILATLKSLATPETEALSVAVLWEDEAYRALDDTNPFCVAIAETGWGTCIEAPLWEEINPEQFLAEDPDVILFLSATGSWQERSDPVWSQLTAVKEGRVYGAAGLYYCCGTRDLVFALHEYAHFVQPDLVAAPGPMATYDPEQSPLLSQE